MVSTMPATVTQTTTFTQVGVLLIFSSPSNRTGKVGGSYRHPARRPRLGRERREAIPGSAQVDLGGSDSG